MLSYKVSFWGLVLICMLKVEFDDIYVSLFGVFRVFLNFNCNIVVWGILVL